MTVLTSHVLLHYLQLNVHYVKEKLSPPKFFTRICSVQQHLSKDDILINIACFLSEAIIYFGGGGHFATCSPLRMTSQMSTAQVTTNRAV